MQCRLIIDDAQSGVWNMAVDEALLETVVEDPTDATATVRFYRWNQPTLSLGYFQRFADRPENLSGVPLVRRLTGGGAILHDRELTYSIILPAGRWPVEPIRELVAQIHQCVADVADSGPTPELHPGIVADVPEPFLCFQRRSTGDLVVGEHKVLGSAQRSRRGALLQHGSILLERSDVVPHLLGLADCGVRASEERVAAAIVERLADRWGWTFAEGTLTSAERDRARELEMKFSSPEWNERR